jgi:hypothetical protein
MPQGPEVDAHVEVGELDYRSPDRYILDGIDRILGDGRKSHLVSDPRAKPSRLPQLAIDGIRPLHWDELSDTQRKELEKLIPTRRTTMVEYGDSPVVVGTPEAWAKRRKRKELTRRAGEQRHQRDLSARGLSEPGLRVLDME